MWTNERNREKSREIDRNREESRKIEKIHAEGEQYLTGYRIFLVSETMVLRGLGKNYGDRVPRESIDEAIRGAQGSKNHRKTIENLPKTSPKNAKFGHVLLLAL